MNMNDLTDILQTGKTLIMSESAVKALEVVKREEDYNAAATSRQADTAAASGNYKEANKAADKSEEHANNATNIGAVTGSG